MKRFQENQQDLVVPVLWEYECVSGLRAAVHHHHIQPEAADLALQVLLAIEPRRIDPTPELHRSAMRWADRLGQNKVYDAQYVALAESLGAEFWSADERLVNTLKTQGADWAHWVGEGG